MFTILLSNIFAAAVAAILAAGHLWAGRKLKTCRSGFLRLIGNLFRFVGALNCIALARLVMVTIGMFA